MEVQELHAWTTQQLQAVADKLAPVWANWLADWGVGLDAKPICTAAASHSDAREWCLMAQRGPACAWLAAGCVDEVANALFGVHPRARALAARNVAGDALLDLKNALAAALQLLPCPPDAPVKLPPIGTWSGTVKVALPFQRPLPLLLNAACVGAVLPPKPKQVQDPTPAVVPLAQAIGPQLVRLNVELNACELDVGTLRGLRVGDVLQLPHPLDMPAQVRGGSRQLVCDAYLGKLAGRKAIELVRSRNRIEEKV